MKTTLILLVLGLTIVLLSSGCDEKSDTVGSGSAGTYVGNFITTMPEAGLVVVTVSSSGSVSGYALLWEDSLVTVSVSGTMENNQFTGTASDGTPLSGTLSGGTISGSAGVDATYSLKLATGTVTLLKYEGTFTGSTESGGLFIATVATTMWGLVFSAGQQSGPDHLVGTVTGSSLSARNATDPNTEVAAGTLSGNTWSGTYTGSSDSGTWTVTLIP